jgi:hypothetical protein
MMVSQRGVGGYPAKSNPGSSQQAEYRADAALDWCDRTRYCGGRRLFLRGGAEHFASR